MYDDDDIDKGAFLLILGTLAAVISIVSWWFLTNNAATTTTSAPAVTVADDLVARVKAALAVDKTDASITGLDVSKADPGTTIVLKGQVVSLALKTKAGEIAAAVPGVAKVDNQLLVASPTTTTVAPPTTAAPAARTVTDLVTTTADLSTLSAQLTKAGLADTLRGTGPFTLFAPTNSAFNSMDAALKRSTDVNTDRLKKVLTYHVISGRLSPTELATKTSLDTVEGEKLTVQAGNPVKLADGKLAVQRSVEVGNGIVYFVDALAVPPSVTQALKDEATLNEVVRLEPIRFATGSADILADSRATLDRAVAALRTITGNVEIGGHTDSTGSAAGNLALSQARAAAVRQYLIDAGIPAARLTAVGYGPDQPVATNDTDEGRALNRRIEFRLL